MGFAAPIATIAAGTLSAGSSILGGFQASQSQKGQAALYAQQASVARANARNTQIRGDIAEARAKKQAAQFLGTQKAKISGSGLTGATAQDILSESSENLSQDILNLEYDNLISELNLTNEAAQLDSAAAGMESAASGSLISGVLSGAGTLLGTFTSPTVAGAFSSMGGSSCAAKKKCGGY